jgi:hypothetical protein
VTGSGKWKSKGTSGATMAGPGPFGCYKATEIHFCKRWEIGDNRKNRIGEQIGVRDPLAEG